MALKIAVVGLRGIGNTHCQSHSKDPLAKLVAVCDVVKERADTAAQKYGARAYYNVAELLRNEEIDILDVTTGGYDNGSWHFEPAMQGLEAGKHVMVEKPLSNEISEARQLVATAAAKNLYLGCNLNHYFTPVADRAKKYLADGQMGELVYCLHKMGFNGGEAGYAPATSTRVKDLPYFHLRAFLSHPFADMRYFCGDITHVQAFVDRPGFRRSAGDLMLSIASIHVRFANGAVGYLLSQRGDATYGLGGWWSLEVAGTKGTFCIENCIEKVTYWPARGSAGSVAVGSGPGVTSQPTVTESGITDFSQTFPIRLHAFLEDVTNKVPREKVRGSGRDALAAAEYVHAVIQSYEQGGILARPHALPPLHGDPSAMLE